MAIGKCASAAKAPEDWSTPGRFAFAPVTVLRASVLECGGPPPLFPPARQTVPGPAATLMAAPAAAYFLSAARINFIYLAGSLSKSFLHIGQHSFTSCAL